MDAAQFTQLLETLQQQQTQLLTQLSTQFQAASPKNDSTNFSNIAPFESYDPKKEKFTCYLERFGNYVAMKNITDKAKTAQLLCVSIGSTHYNSLAAFLGPDRTIQSLEYEALVKSFKQMLVPRKSVVVSQHYFLNIFQKEKQSVAEYVAALQRDLAECEFNIKCECTKLVSVADIFLRAQFIRGLRDSWLREQLLQSDMTKFDEILKKATALEASRLESKELTQNSNSQDNASSDTYKILDSISDSNYNHTFRRARHPQGSNSQYRRRSPSYGSSNRSISRNRSQLDYRLLGIDNLCFRCGRSNHKVSVCRTDRNQVKCGLCSKEGHVSKVCITSLLKNSQQKYDSSSSTKYMNAVNHDDANEDSGAEYGISKIEAVQYSPKNCEIVDLFELLPEPDKYLVTVSLNDKFQQFEVDSGAKFSLLAEDDFNRLQLDVPLQRSNVVFRSYTGNLIKPKGKITVDVSYRNKKISGELHIVPTGHAALLGRLWIRGLDIKLQEIDTDMKKPQQSRPEHAIFSINDLFTDFATIFEENIGCVPGFEVKLQLREGAKPVFVKERNVPYALRERVEKELDSLEAAGIITPVPTSDWGSPLVVIPKPDGGVRLCVDYKCGVNERLVNANYPIRRIDDVLNSLRNSKYFCKIDLYKAYLHLKVDQESSIIQTISTHRGTYRMNRLSFGIKTAPSEFNRILTQILRGLSKTEQYFDDVVVHGETIEECSRNLRSCLQRLSTYNLHLNKNKCTFFVEKIDYLGYTVEYNKISKSAEKVRAVQEMPRPANADDLRRFLGLVTYYASFVPDLSSITYPLRQLLSKGQRWFWSSQCEATFIKLKAELQSNRVLVPFDPDLPLVLATDASPTGIAAVLSHNIDKKERPISYASRSLSSAERNYSQLDREALAIIFGVTHFYNYLFGKNFTLITDNEPLTRIFHPHKALPQMTSARLLRYASFLSGFDYTVKFKKGNDNQNVDCLSRAPVKQSHVSTDGKLGEEVNAICSHAIFSISSEHLTFKDICKETRNDPELVTIINDLKNSSTESQYTLHDGVLFRNDRVVIPCTLRAQILSELHDTHLGVMKMKQLARRYVYWPGIDQEIERLVKGCEDCALTKTNPARAPVHPWDEPNVNWERVHIDYAGPFEGHNFLLCIDAKSKWAEIKVIKDAPSSSITIALLNDIFSTHGFPNILVSDNASIFQSEEFRGYCSSNGIFQKFIAPGHPATNGLAERNVQSLKQRLRAASNDPLPIRDKLRNILFRYRATPLANGKSPAEQYLQRKLRIRLDAIFPYHPQSNNVPPGKVRTFTEGERVQARMFLNNKYIWQFGNIQKKLGHLHYNVILDSGRSVKRHIDQLRSTLVTKKTVSFEPSTSFNVPRIPRTEMDRENQNPTVPAPLTTLPEVTTPPTTLQEATSTDLTADIHSRPLRQRNLPSRFRDFVMC